MSDTNSLSVEEYRALRATIRERGTARLIVTALTFVAWSAVAVSAYALFTNAAITLIPLVILATGFEVIFAMHVGVERIGRYLYVHYETDSNRTPCWEHAIAAFGTRAAAGSAIDPLCTLLFILVTIANLVPLVWLTATAGGELIRQAPVLVIFAASVVAHAAFIVRVLGARRFAAGQRARDTSLFEQAAQPQR
jgi:hypothetical protein